MSDSLSTKTIRAKELVDYEKANLYPYEELEIGWRLEGDWLLQLKTNIIVHRKHTQREKFIPQSIVKAAVSTDVPSPAFVDEWLAKARQAALESISRGEYSEERKIGGEWQSVKCKFNQWFYWDRHKQEAVR